MAGSDPSAEYEMLEELGSGSFGVVYKARERRTGELVAIKHIDMDGTEDDIHDIQQEIALLSTCSSPWITKYKTSFVRGVKLWIVMEFLGGGSCLDLIKVAPFDENHAAIVCRELLLGLDYLHTSGKIHRDIKAANVLLSSLGKVKIADFGVAAQLTNIKSQRMTFVGTPFWMAPEVIQESGYDYRADVWSLGITAIELVKGEPPNSDLHPMKALFHIPKASAPRLEGSKFSRDLKSFVACCLVKDPEQRPSARDLLQHRFIQKAGRVDNLKNWIALRRRQQTSSEAPSPPKYYEQTMRDVSAERDEDDWVFDTIKASTIIKHVDLLPPLATSEEPPTELMTALNINKSDTADDLGAAIDDEAMPETVRRRHSVISTVRKSSSPQKRVATPKRQSLSIHPAVQRQPLGIDLSFGNGLSNARQFRRVSSEVASQEDMDPMNDENGPPRQEANNKEAKLGRRIFAKAVGPAIQEVQAQTAQDAKRHALATFEQAWRNLDGLDPEGELLLLRLILDKVQGDSKLSSALLSPQPSGTPQKPKLVLAQNNPHLKSHRRRQSSQVSLVSPMSEKPQGLPGQTQPGFEHTKQLADALYGQWVQGLKQRWQQGA